MPRASTAYLCSACGGQTLKWQGSCPLCGQWNVLEPVRAPRATGRPPAAAAVPLTLQDAGAELRRLSSGLAELDRVLGGGIVPGSVTLLGGDPGIGKSTLLLQVAAHAAGGAPVLYASGEESDRKSTRLNSSHIQKSRMPSSA